MAQQLVKETREAAGEDENPNSSTREFGPARVEIHRVGSGTRLLGLRAVEFCGDRRAIFWLSKKNLPGLFRNRTASIQKAMEEARKTSEDANRRLAEIEARLSRLDIEIGGMRAAAEKEAAAEEQRIKAAAEEDARKIVESAEQEIAAAAKVGASRTDSVRGRSCGVVGEKTDPRGCSLPIRHCYAALPNNSPANGGETRKGGQ